MVLPGTFGDRSQGSVRRRTLQESDTCVIAGNMDFNTAMTVVQAHRATSED